MDASHNLVSNSSENSCLAQAGGEYVVYVLNDNSVNLNLKSVQGEYRVRTFNPKNGKWVSINMVSGGKTQSFIKPSGADDWVVHVKKKADNNSPPRPAAPSSLVASALSSSAIKISWKDNSGNESQFRIDRRKGNGLYSKIAIVSANSTTFINTGLVANTAYTYRVRAENPTGNSGSSNSASAKTDSNIIIIKPAPPSNLVASALSSSAIKLSWKDNSGNESQFRIDRRKGNGLYSKIATVSANSTTFMNTGLVGQYDLYIPGPSREFSGSF